MKAHTWSGRRGRVLLGPTQHRVALWLDRHTTAGRVRITTRRVADELGLERSEAFRVLARLRVLGLFGIANDRGGHRGGRWVWRTAAAHDGPGLDPGRHREAWRRILGWSRAARSRALERLHHLRLAAVVESGVQATRAPAPESTPAPVASFAEGLRRYGAGALLDSWRIT